MILTNLFSGQQWRNRHREQTYGHGERGGEGEMYGKSNMETYITMCKTDSQCRLLDSSHPDWRVMVPHCGFDLCFSDNE